MNVYYAVSSVTFVKCGNITEIVFYPKSTLKGFILQIVLYLGDPVLLFVVAFLLSIVLYIFWAVGATQKKLLEHLKSELVDITKDKAVLLKELQNEGM